MSQSRAVATLAAYAVGCLVIGAAVTTGADLKGTGVAWALAAFVDLLLPTLAVWFVYGAWTYATGQRPAADVNPECRREKFWQRWPIFRQP